MKMNHTQHLVLWHLYPLTAFFLSFHLFLLSIKLQEFTSQRLFPKTVSNYYAQE
jgi:hypothetical protein